MSESLCVPGFADSERNTHILSSSSTVIYMLLRSFTPEPEIWTFPDVGGTLRLHLDPTGYRIWFPCIYLHYVLASKLRLTLSLNKYVCGTVRIPCFDNTPPQQPLRSPPSPGASSSSTDTPLDSKGYSQTPGSWLLHLFAHMSGHRPYLSPTLASSSRRGLSTPHPMASSSGQYPASPITGSHPPSF